MKNLLSIITLLFVGFSLSAQPLNKETVASMIETAEEQMALENWYDAREWYQKAYDETKDKDLKEKIAVLSYQLRDYRKAVRNYKSLLRRDKNDKYGKHRFEYARSLKMNGQPQEAIDEFDKYLKTATDPMKKELAELEKQGAEYALVAKQVEKDMTITNAGKGVNKKNSEYNPFLAEDGNTMYYSSLANDEIIILDGKEDNWQARAFSATKNEDGWGEGEELGENINRPGYHISNIKLSPNGKQMFYCQQLLSGNVLSESKIYVSNKNGGTWSAGKEVVGINEEGTLNKAPASGELFGKKVLFFASNRDGGEGGFDLYYATEKGDGVYADPVNLGPRLNTVGNEEDPFYRDGMLYFSSDAHPGIGGFDIFKTEWNGVKWSDPQNMGLGYNSPVDDMAFMLDQEGYRGVLTSNRISKGARSVVSKTCCNDIYAINLRKIEVDLMAVTLDSLDSEPLKGVMVEIVEMIDGKPQPIDSKKNPTGNKFEFPLELDKSYRLVASLENYETKELDFNTVGVLDNKTFEETLILKPLPKTITITSEEPFVLENILYDFNKDNIRSDAEPSLEFIYELLTEYPDMKIELSSHTDARGGDAANQSLAQRRAESARRWLLQRGNGVIKRFRITAKGYGETVPQTVNAKNAARYSFLNQGDVLTEEFIDKIEGEENQETAHQLNRRTEFKITDGPKSIKIEETRLIQLGNKKIDETINESKDKQSMPKATTPKKKLNSKQQPPTEIHKFSSLYGRKDLKGVPVLQFDNRMVDLGTVKKGEKRQHTYAFKNIGDTTAEIDLISACDCTTTNESKRTIEPGESAKIDITFDSSQKNEAETIDIDIYLKNITPGDEMPVIETIKYKFEIAK